MYVRATGNVLDLCSFVDCSVRIADAVRRHAPGEQQLRVGVEHARTDNATAPGSCTGRDSDRRKTAENGLAVSYSYPCMSVLICQQLGRQAPRRAVVASLPRGDSGSGAALSRERLYTDALWEELASSARAAATSAADAAAANSCTTPATRTAAQEPADKQTSKLLLPRFVLFSVLSASASAACFQTVTFSHGENLENTKIPDIIVFCTTGKKLVSDVGQF